MPEGFAGIRDAAADIERRKSSGGDFDETLRLKLKDGESATVRFLEQDDDVAWCWTHKMPPVGRQQWGDDLPCLDQKREGTVCPACQSDRKVGKGDDAKKISDRSFNGFINVIWDEAPVFKRDSDDRIARDENKNAIVADRKPQVAVWNQGITVFEELDGINSTYKGLRSRKFVITRKGTRFNTKYSIRPLDPDGGPQAFTEDELKLEKEKYDLKQFTTPLSGDDMSKRVNGDGGSSSNGSVDQAGAEDIAPFMG
jgi:hypothetical protein